MRGSCSQSHACRCVAGVRVASAYKLSKFVEQQSGTLNMSPSHSTRLGPSLEENRIISVSSQETIVLW